MVVQRSLSFIVGLAVLQLSSAFLPVSQQPSGRNCPLSLRAEGGGPFQGVKNFFAELDAFIDDASARRLGNGAAFYGKRKSNFYGEKDKMKKTDRDTPDPTEDYQGPSGAGYFKWMPDENGKLDDRHIGLTMLVRSHIFRLNFCYFQAD
ncbi:hypothetical protein FisN_1Lh174 [Fistulifera solaris]|uniref:Uncharacterized protein n=1 Tax=Fistulifera solaris TaxID=1519565 RepID=A0A1Z5K525_FISSO|nr:hypothetical protein FisN_1Lh174 [Fistulifera solaris]|eukprot:GAX21337.1 hypothetical protein FisN_1Lh174 [Fistulifera solaris]